MSKTRGPIGTHVLRGAARVGWARNPAMAGNRVGASRPLPSRPDPAVASRVAGARGTSAPGVDYVDRLTHYQEQNGPPYKCTPCQERRLRHKAHHQEAQARRAIEERERGVAVLRAALRGGDAK